MIATPSTSFDLHTQERERIPPARLERGGVNVGSGERVVVGALGAGLVYLGISRRTPLAIAGAVVGVLMLKRAVTGHCAMYATLGAPPWDARAGSNPLTRSAHGSGAVTISRPVAEVFSFWRDLRNLARVMPSVQRVQPLTIPGDGPHDRSHWEAQGPLGKRVQWDARIVEERDNELIRWETLPGATVWHRGEVSFKEAPGDRGTEVRLAYEYRPPLGMIGVGAARLTGNDPQFMFMQGLRQLKQLLEAGEIATAAGPSARSSHPSGGEKFRHPETRFS